jgi:hypothetical protein
MLIILLITIYCIPNKIIHLGHNKPPNKESWHDRAIIVFSDVKIGYTKEQVLEIIHSYNWPETLILNKDAEIRLFTPFEFPASNWIIIFSFSDGKLSYAKVRRESGPDSPYRPNGAPEDLRSSDDVNRSSELLQKSLKS